MLDPIPDTTILKYDRQVPRYTSYPTAPFFSAKVDNAVYLKWLKAIPEAQTLSLYLHIPFCDQLCWYCGCYTKITKRYAPIEDYVHILAREIAMVADLLQEGHHLVNHIHFGGGSPTSLLPKDFEFLIDIIRSKFVVSDDAQIAVEIDPRNVNEEKIATYSKLGVNRVSFGVQDFNEEVQVAINRQQSFDVVYDAMKLCRKYHINDINLDLIYGLPKQTVEMVKKNIDYAMLLKPSRIALFAYAHVRWKKKHMRLIDENDLPDGLVRIKMYKAASQKLNKEGFLAIGLDHFARAEDDMAQAFNNKELKRNFQGYSVDSASYVIGLGVSSIGFLEKGYVQNTLDFSDYKKSILSNQLACIKGVEINQDDKIRKKLIDALMCYMQVDLNQIIQEFALEKDYFDNEIDNLKELIQDGLVMVKNKKITINLQAPQISRVVSSVFDAYFSPIKDRHSKMS